MASNDLCIFYLGSLVRDAIIYRSELYLGGIASHLDLEIRDIVFSTIIPSLFGNFYVTYVSGDFAKLENVCALLAQGFTSLCQCPPGFLNFGAPVFIGSA